MQRALRRNTVPPSLDASRVINGLYLALLGRPATESDIGPYAEFLYGGGSFDGVVAQMLESPECQLNYVRTPAFRHLVAPDPVPEGTARLYVSHIPKTAGTSLRMMLKQHFDPLEVCDGLTLSELNRLSPARLRSFRFITGHFGPVLPPMLGDVPLITATMLRDPVAIVPSIYGQWRDHGPDGHPITEMSRALPFDEWCRQEETRSKWSNPQARALALPRVAAAWPGPTESPEGAADDTVSLDRLRTLAIECLDGTDIVGTTEDVGAVYRTCVDRLGLVPRSIPVARENVGRGLELPMSEDSKAWLTAQNTIDAELVARAQGRRDDLLPA